MTGSYRPALPDIKILEEKGPRTSLKVRILLENWKIVELILLDDVRF